MSRHVSPVGIVRAWSRRIGVQIATLVFLAALFTYAGNLLVVRSFELSPNNLDDLHFGNMLFAALPILAETAPEKRQAIVDLVNLMAPRLDMTIEAKAIIPETARRIGKSNGAPNNGPANPPKGEPPGAPGGQGIPRGLFGGNATFYSLGEITTDTDQKLQKTLIVLSDGAGVHANLPLPPEPPSFFSSQFTLGNWLVLLVIVLPVALFWAVVGVSRPLRRFARAAEEFSIDGPYAPLMETGPEEIRAAARALNSMRRRIAVMAADRTRMLSAVGHDLRTPVTRMRLRTEFIEDSDIRAGYLRDLARMEAMIDNTLSFLRDGHVKGTRTPTDIVSLMQTLIDDFAAIEADISLSAPERLVCSVEPDAIRRVVENLIQNGLKFGTKVQVTLAAIKGDSVEIRVEDDGPGIPEAQRQDMLKPFVTGDAARSGTSAGFGLGLSIAEAIVQAHDGTLDLGDSPLGGLLVRVALPSR